MTPSPSCTLRATIRTLILARKLAFLILLTSTGTALAQSSSVAFEPDLTALPPTLLDGSQVYAVEQFSRFAPQTAADLAQQIPGFSISGVSNDRGLGDASQNVLINGQRITGKGNNAQTALARIPVNSVLRLEIIDGARLSISGLSGQVLNVVTRQEGVKGNFVWRPQIRERGIADHWLNAEANLAGKLGAGSYTLGISNNGFRGGGRGNELVRDASDALLFTRKQRMAVGNDRPRLAATYSTTTDGGSLFNVNAKAEKLRFDRRSTSDFQISGNPAVSELRSGGVKQWNTEIGTDYDFALAEGRLKLVGFYTYKHDVPSNEFRSTAAGSPTTGQQFNRLSNEGETVLRTEYRWKALEGDWTVSAEAAYNFLDATGSLAVLDSSGAFQPIPLPGASSRVEEKRGQSALSYSRTLTAGWSLQTTLGGEYSKLSQNTGLTRNFWRPKGAVSVAWKASPLLDFNLRLQRKVGQLNFFDFLASVDVQNSIANGSNPELVPPQSWELELEAIRSLGALGSLTFKITGESISDIVDQIPISPAAEATGNLPKASRLIGSVAASLLLDSWGFPGAKLDLFTLQQTSSVRDPVLGRHRPLSNRNCCYGRVELRQDVPATLWTWGFFSEHSDGNKFYRLDYQSRDFNSMPFLAVYLEHKNVFGMKARLTVQNALNGKERTQEIYYVDRRDGPINYTQDRTNDFGRIYRLQLSGTF
jgi:hypothetical protein